MNESSGLEIPNPQESQSVPRQWRFDRLMELNRQFVFKRPEVLGIENLAEIPANSPLLVITSHFSDADVQTVESVLRPRLRQVRPDRGLGISLQAHNLVDPVTALPIKLAGREHFFEYDVRFDKPTNHLQFIFNPENFRKMAQALLGRRDLITAAHEPLSNIPGSAWELPNRSGLGAAYLAQLTNATILPATVDIQTTHPVAMAVDIQGTIKRLVTGQRANVRVILGRSLRLDPIDQEALGVFERYISRLGQPEESRSQIAALSPAEKAQARVVLRQLRDQSDLIMRKIAELLPEQKRGRWR